MRQLPAELQHKVLTQLGDCRDVLRYSSTHKHNECDWPRLMEDWYLYRDDAPPGYEFNSDAATARFNYQKQCRRSTFTSRVWHVLMQVLFDPNVIGTADHLRFSGGLDDFQIDLALNEFQQGVVRAAAEHGRSTTIDHPFVEILRVMSANIERGEPNFVPARTVNGAINAMERRLGIPPRPAFYFGKTWTQYIVSGFRSMGFEEFRNQLDRGALSPRFGHVLMQVLFDPKVNDTAHDLNLSHRLHDFEIRLALNEFQQGVVRAAAEHGRSTTIDHPFVEILRVMSANIERGEPNFVPARTVNGAINAMERRLGIPTRPAFNFGDPRSQDVVDGFRSMGFEEFRNQLGETFMFGDGSETFFG